MRRHETLAEQLDGHDINRDVAREMRRDQARLREDIEKLIDAARKNYNSAAAMHSMDRVSHFGGKIAALQDVLKLI
jgi:hypothetical protein